MVIMLVGAAADEDCWYVEVQHQQQTSSADAAAVVVDGWLIDNGLEC